MTKDEALKLALEKFEFMNHVDSIFEGEFNFQINAIKEALAQPEHDYKDLYEKEKRRSAMWLSKYEEVAGPAPKAIPMAQPEQEPVAWRNAAIRIGEELSSVGPDGYYDMTAEQWLDWAMEQEPRGKNSLAQSERDGECKYCTDGCPACDATKLPKEAHDLF